MGNAHRIESARLHNQKRNRTLRSACERVVRACRMGLESLESRQLLSLPAGWESKDIQPQNTAMLPGSADFADDTFTLGGSGNDIWNAADMFHYAYQNQLLDGDGEIIARVQSFYGVTPDGAQDGWAKAGVMFRSSLNADSTHAGAVVSSGNGAQLLVRGTTAGGSASQTVTGYRDYTLLKLARVGNTFTAYIYDDYIGDWAPLADANTGNAYSYTINVPNKMYTGLAVTAHNINRLDQATFTEVQINSRPDTDEPGAPMNLWANGGPDAKSIVVTWLDNASNETAFVLERSTDPNFTNVTQINLPADTYSYTDNDVTVGTNYYYRLRAVNAAGSSEFSNSSMMTAGLVSGLTTRFFNANNNYALTPALTRIDQNINFDWGDNAPGTGVNADNFSTLFTGRIQVPQSGEYTFISRTDDDGYVWVDGQLVSFDPGGHGARDPWESTTGGGVTPIQLEAGKWYNFVFKHAEGTGGAVAQLDWIRPDGVRERVPAGAFVTTMDTPKAPSSLAVNTDLPYQFDLTWVDNSVSELNYAVERSTDPNFASYEVVAKVGSDAISATDWMIEPNKDYYYRVRAYNYEGSSTSNVVHVKSGTETAGPGLLGQYFNGYAPNGNLDGTLALTQWDAKVEFGDWGEGSPAAGIVNNDFQVIWQGTLIVPTTGDYIFGTASDDGIRLWVNGELATNAWVGRGGNTAPQERSKAIRLEAGEYPIVISYHDSGGGASARLFWSGPGIAEQIIPAENLKGLIAKPAAATNFAANAGPISMDVSWTNNAVNETFERLEISKDDGKTWTVVKKFRTDDGGQSTSSKPSIISNVGGAATQVPNVSITGLQPNTTYKFRVITSNARGEVVSEFSAATANVPPGNITVNQGTPAANTNLTGDTNLDWVHWGYDQSATGYDVRYYGSNLIPNYQVIGTGTPVAYNATGANFSWTDGRPNADAVKVTAPGDSIVGFPEVREDGSAAWPAGENPSRTIDNQTGTKLLNFAKLNTGLIITPSAGASVINAIGLTSANDAPERDPANYVIEGSNDGGVTWTRITEGVVPAFSARFQQQVFRFENTKSYTSYKVTFPTVQNPTAANSMQIDEVSLYKSNMSTVAATDDAVAVAGEGNGFKFTVPAQPANRRLKVYVAVDGDAQGQLVATLSDSSAPVYTSAVLSAGGSLKTAVYTIDYRSGLADKQLTIEWKSVGGTGNVILQAASLSDVDAPVAPTDLAIDSRFISDTIVTWKDNSTNEAGYRLERTLAGQNNWAVLANLPANSTRYSDLSAVKGSAYEYRVTAFNAVGAATSNEASATIAMIPEGWEGKNIGTSGDPGYAGDWGYNSTTGEWNIRASGSDIWNNVNHFYYAYQPVSGDVRMTARITAEAGVDGWAKAGIMLAETLETNSRWVAATATPGNQVRIQGWDNGNIDIGAWGTNMNVTGAVNWMRVERMGQVVTLSYSPDGQTWTVMGTRMIDWSQDLYIGLAYTMHNNSNVGIATFDNVSIEDIEDVKPVAPENLQAVAVSQNRVVLTWNDKANNETSYVVQRRAGSGAWEDIAYNLPANTKFFEDFSTADSVSYTYRVYATGFAGDSGYSNNSASVKSGLGTFPVENGWTGVDVGATTYTGSNGYLNGVYDVSGSGGDIWGTAGDAFHFVYKEMTGDFVISGQVLQQKPTAGWAKAGFMIRGGTDDGYGNMVFDPSKAGAPMAMLVTTPEHNVQYGWRTTFEGNPGEVNNAPANPYVPTQGTPTYLRLARVNGEITAWTSVDNIVWTQLGGVQNIGNDPVYVGMAVTSTNVNEMGLATFKDVSLTAYNAAVTPDAPSDLAAVGLGSKDVVLTWVDHSMNETGFKVERSANGVDGWTVIGETARNATRFVDRNAAGQTYYYRVVATNTLATPTDSASTNVVSATVGVDGAPIHQNDFADASDWQLNGKATVVDNVLRITDSVNDQLSSAFTKLPQSLNNFKASFDMLMSGGTGADGMAFVIQANDSKALGGGGGGLGYTGIKNSLAIKFDIYKAGAHDIDETGLYFNGDSPQYDAANDPENADIDLRPSLGFLTDTKWRVTLTSENGKLTMTMAKADAPGTILFTHTWDIDVAAALGVDSGFVGFTGATGGANVKQEIYNFHFGPVNEPDPTGDWVINGTDSDETMTLKRVGDNVQLLDSTGNIVAQKPFAQITNIVVNGKGGNDTLILDYSGGELVAAANNVAFDGGAGNDLVKLAANAGSNALVINAAGVSFGGRTINLANVESKGLALSGTAAVSLAAGGTSALKLGSLSIADNAKLDLADNDLIVTATAETKAAVLAAISNAIKSARGSGAWTGKGLTSSAAAGNKQTGLSVMLNDKAGQAILNSFAGQAVTNNDILVKYTWNGDVTLDGKVDIDDYFLVDSGFITQQGQYRNGDLNLDGQVDIDDYFLIDSAFIAQTGVLGAEEAPAQVQAQDVVTLKAEAAKPQETSSVLEQLFSVKPVL